MSNGCAQRIIYMAKHLLMQLIYISSDLCGFRQLNKLLKAYSKLFSLKLEIFAVISVDQISEPIYFFTLHRQQDRLDSD